MDVDCRVGSTDYLKLYTRVLAKYLITLVLSSLFLQRAHVLLRLVYYEIGLAFY